MADYTDQKTSVRILAERAPGYRASFKATKKSFQDIRDAIAAALAAAAPDTTDLAAYAGSNKAVLAEKDAAALIIAELTALDTKIAAVQVAIAAVPA